VVEEIIGRLPRATAQGFLRGRGERALPKSMQAPRRPSPRSWSTAPTRTAICSWSYAATSVVTGRLVSADPTGTSSTTRVASVGSSTWAKPATHRALWPPSGQSPWGSRSLPWSGSALKDEKRQLERLGTSEGRWTRYMRKIVTNLSLPQPGRYKADLSGRQTLPERATTA
jgi:hypothetical protein